MKGLGGTRDGVSKDRYDMNKIGPSNVLEGRLHPVVD